MLLQSLAHLPSPGWFTRLWRVYPPFLWRPPSLIPGDQPICVPGRLQKSLGKRPHHRTSKKQLTTTDLVGGLLSLAWLRTMSFAIPDMRFGIVWLFRHPSPPHRHSGDHTVTPAKAGVQPKLLLSSSQGTSRTDVRRNLAWMPDQVRHDVLRSCYDADSLLANMVGSLPVWDLRPHAPPLTWSVV